MFKIFDCHVEAAYREPGEDGVVEHAVPLPRVAHGVMRSTSEVCGHAFMEGDATGSDRGSH